MTSLARISPVQLISISILVVVLFSCHCRALDSNNYAEALEKSIMFFEGQRSGKLPPNQRVTWRGDSGLKDGSTENVDLSGGYYDAGDNVKFGLPLAFTTTMLAWSVVEFGRNMKHQAAHARDAIRWSTDYLLKAATAKPDTLYVQVGDPNADHECWQRPEDLDSSRNVYKVSTKNPGSDIAGETAAALAAASVVFKRSDRPYSTKLLQTAIKVFDFADQHRGSYSDSLSSVVCPFYCSYSGYNDELLWAAAWLYRATKDDKYLNYIKTNGHTDGGDDDDFSFSWDDKRVGTKVLLSKFYLQKKVQDLQSYKNHADNYFCSLLPGSPTFSTKYTPGGLLFKQGECNMQYVTSTAFLLVTYAKYLQSSGESVSCGSKGFAAKDLIALAKKQVDYILGDNPSKMSYMVGFGEKYPQKVHHRGSSIPSIRQQPSQIACKDGFQHLNSGSPNPNILVGAIMGGPDQGDSFNDDRNNHEQSEPATYFNAPFVGAVAYFAGSPPTSTS
ncbi:endoglucanase 1-like [Papaver somniferum]|uniref:endoglucanase 1-like n=1 Tax=Papaver somniferum TaxID=3469 RepID=UPI000E6FBD18|nr:endoglucanase 1-like [Papaver somniferum]